MVWKQMVVFIVAQLISQMLFPLLLQKHARKPGLWHAAQPWLLFLFWQALFAWLSLLFPLLWFPLFLLSFLSGTKQNSGLHFPVPIRWHATPLLHYNYLF